MASTRTLVQLRTATRELADIEVSAHIDDTELTGWINLAIKRLHALLAKARPDRVATTASIATDGNANGAYALPSDWLGTIAVDWVESATAPPWPLKKIGLRERRLRLVPGMNRAYGWNVVGSNVVLYPYPPTGQTYTHHYISTPTALSADADTYDGIIGFEDYILNDCAARAAQKEESDPTIFLRARDKIEVDLMEEAQLATVLDGNCVEDVEEAEKLHDFVDWRWGRGV